MTERRIRRGLPRYPGGEPWPPQVGPGVIVETAVAAVADEPAPQIPPVQVAAAPAAPQAGPPSMFRRRLGPALLGAIVVVGVAAIVVGVAQWLVTQSGVQSFLQQFPGRAPLPAGAPIGFPAWVAVQHFFNTILMVLIIRTGLQIRWQQRPPLMWSPAWAPKRRISITLWMHQSLDLLWLANGGIFVVLLFASGQWMRIVPTSMAVLPNALSALLQYATLDWPTENGWIDYNALQQLAYFTIVFVAAPIATLTGLRMSASWPQGSAAANRIIRISWVRPLHVGTMLFFSAFIVVHVVLVLTTGALRNLDHMYAVRGSADPGAFSADLLGLWIFLASLGAVAGAWLAARPLLVVPIARRFGAVSER